jgi:hypothetical protein
MHARGEFYLYAIKKVASDLYATEKFVCTRVPLTQTFATLMPFRPVLQVTVSTKQMKWPFYPSTQHGSFHPTWF